MSEPESPRRVSIRIAGNTEIPCLLAIEAKGFRVWLDYLKWANPIDPRNGYQPDYQAEHDGAYFSATSAEALLGLIAMWEFRGDDWRLKKGEGAIHDRIHDAARTYDSDGNLLPDE
jgi:hypothetical protein